MSATFSPESKPGTTGAAVTVSLSRLLAFVLVLFLALPLLALALGGSDSSAGTNSGAGVLSSALRLSFATTALSLGIILLCGTPLAWHLARSNSRWNRVIEVVVQMPIVMPPAVAGVALLLTFGSSGLIGQRLHAAGVNMVFTSTAVVIAQVFVAAPFYVRGAASAFRALDEGMLLAARSLGASQSRVMMAIAIPCALPSLVSAAAMAWARALGEFGATLLFAGSLPGKTQTVPLAIYAAMELDMDAARHMSLMLVGIAALVLLAVRTLTSSREGKVR